MSIKRKFCLLKTPCKLLLEGKINPGLETQYAGVRSKLGVETQRLNAETIFKTENK